MARKLAITKVIASFLKAEPKSPLIVVLGPTASGKTALAIKIAQRFDGEIVSADSRQIYRELDLGTAKPDAKELAAAPHHLVSVRSPTRPISVARYRQLAEVQIRTIQKRGKLPIIAGGHTLLISAIVENYQFPKAKANPARRTALTKIYRTKTGPQKLWRRLNKLDPTAATKIPPENEHHLLRALELAEQLGQTEKAKTKGRRKFNCLLLGLNPDREQLYKKINQRADAMLQAGLLAEVKQLAKKYDRYSPPLRGHGYRELLDYLHGEKTLAKAVEEIKQDTRNYAKRQMTWLKNCGFAAEIIWL